jgi:Arc/MetJ family transcription regulator
MRIGLHLDDDLAARARELTGIKDSSALVAEALRVLVAKESAKRLAALGGTMPGLSSTRRRYSSRAKR